MLILRERKEKHLWKSTFPPGVSVRSWAWGFSDAKKVPGLGFLLDPGTENVVKSSDHTVHSLNEHVAPEKLPGPN